MTNPVNAIKDVVTLMQIDIPSILMGAPGVGKSDIGRAAAREYLATDDLITHGPGRNYIDFRATLIDPVDLHGLPTVDKEAMIARWVPMGLLPQEGVDAERGVLMIDELPNADASVKAALYGLVLDRFIGDYRVPAGWRIIAAGNRVEDRAAASHMGSALANRFTHLTIEPTVDDWINWAMGNKVPAVMIAFMRFRGGDLLHNFEPARPINATPRTWSMVAKIVEANPTDDVMDRLILGTVGDGPGAEFLAFLKIWRELPNVDAVLMNPEQAIVPETSAALYAICTALAARVGEHSFEGMVRYLDRLPPEFNVMAMKDATTRKPELCSTSTFIEWGAQHQDFYV